MSCILEFEASSGVHWIKSELGQHSPFWNYNSDPNNDINNSNDLMTRDSLSILEGTFGARPPPTSPSVWWPWRVIRDHEWGGRRVLANRQQEGSGQHVWDALHRSDTALTSSFVIIKPNTGFLLHNAVISDASAKQDLLANTRRSKGSLLASWWISKCRWK